MPLQFDMPLKELYSYQGRNPKPSDFDDFWERGMSEMRSIDPDIKLNQSDFKAPFADCFDLYFIGVGGAKIHAKYVRPAIPVSGKQDVNAPAVLKFHGYTGDSGDWHDLLPYAAAGFHIFAMDCRGQGGLSEDSGGVKGTTLNGHIIRGLDDEPDKLMYRQIFLDTAELFDIAAGTDGVDPKRIGAFGGSQGGALTIACAALQPSIMRLVPKFPFLCDYRRVWEIDMGERAYKELSDFFRRHDPLHEREKEIFLKLGYIDVQHLADRIRGDILMAVGLLDKTCPPSTQFAAYNKITSPKQLKIYPDYGHENLPGMNDIQFEFLMGL
jgi:cephalosporin-C deacetylase